MIENIPKFFPEKSDNNIVVEVSISNGGDIYKATGVLIKELDNSIRLGFNSKNDKVIDFLDIDYKDILDLRKIETGEIMVLE